MESLCVRSCFAFNIQNTTFTKKSGAEVTNLASSNYFDDSQDGQCGFNGQGKKSVQDPAIFPGMAGGSSPSIIRFPPWFPWYHALYSYRGRYSICASLARDMGARFVRELSEKAEVTCMTAISDFSVRRTTHLCVYKFLGNKCELNLNESGISCREAVFLF